VTQSKGDITALLRAAATGERRDLDALLVAVYDDVKQLAESHLRRERANHTLQPTALVHEAFLRLIDQRSTNWQDRAHFFSICARILRRIIVDHARNKGALKRGAGLNRVAIAEESRVAATDSLDLIALDEALDELQGIDGRQAKIVELRFFGGLTLQEIADTLSIGRRTVDREWSVAKAWLLFRLSDDGARND